MKNKITDTVRLTEYVTIHDTTYVPVHDTAIVTVPVHDTTVVTVRHRDTMQQERVSIDQLPGYLKANL